MTGERLPHRVFGDEIVLFEKYPTVCRRPVGQDQIILAPRYSAKYKQASIAALALRQARQGGLSAGKSKVCLWSVPRDHAVAAAAVLRLTARQRCSRMTIVTPYTPTMTAGMTTNL